MGRVGRRSTRRLLEASHKRTIQFCKFHSRGRCSCEEASDRHELLHLNMCPRAATDRSCRRCTDSECRYAHSLSEVIQNFNLELKFFSACDGAQEGSLEDQDTVFSTDDHLRSRPIATGRSRMRTLEDPSVKSLVGWDDVGLQEHMQSRLPLWNLRQVAAPFAVIVRNTFLDFKCPAPRHRSHSSPAYSRT